MRTRSRSLTWHGQPFRFEYLAGPAARTGPMWAVYRRAEFIGTMPCPTDIPTKEFDLRGCHWLDELLRTAKAKG
jgi:hypothetical protein